MDWLKLLFSFLKEVVPTIVTFIAGKKSKELEDIKDENKKLKKYNDIDEDEYSSNDAYNARMWE